MLACQQNTLSSSGSALMPLMGLDASSFCSLTRRFRAALDDMS